MFYPTEKGKEEFFKWINQLQEGEVSGFDFYEAYPFLEKCTFFNHLSPEETLSLVENQLTIEKAKLEEFERVRGKMLERGVNRYRVRIIEFGIEFQKIKLAWLEQLRSEILRDAASDNCQV